MSRPEFKSGFAAEINSYLDYKVACGYKEQSFNIILREFDHFCIRRGITYVVFTKDDADAWSEKRDTEASTSHYARVNKVKCFMEYLSLKGYDVFLMHDVFFKATDFQPHIYTDDEILRYFSAVDSYSSGNSRMDAIQFPVLFRLLYCCGTRINETLGIRKRDVDLDNGIIRLLETKNDCERFIVLSAEMKGLLYQFSDKYFYLLDEDDYIFSSVSKTRRDESRLYDIHRLILRRAGIPYVGGGRGPRVHDWRHTFAVRSFKQMIDRGIDMYVALPILSTYLGHKTIYATERYVRLTMDLYPYINEKCSAKFQSIFRKAANIDEAD